MAKFPEGFLWGAATAAYQIEGSPLADGAGPSDWYRFAHTPGRTVEGAGADDACDHYRRWREDVGIMRELGLRAYRFSLAWARILPEGTGRVNRAGLDFYSRLVDELLAHRIQPLVTLYHWDLPAALGDRGGWLNPEVTDWFAEYARVAYGALGDRVRLWATLNEPWVVADGGYLHGKLAPGHSNLFEAPIATHNLLRAHVAGVRALREAGAGARSGDRAGAGAGAGVGLVVNLELKQPASQREEDRAATRRAEAYMNRQYLDPLFLGRYPQEMAEIFGEAWPRDADRDLGSLREPLDFLGINYYTRGVTRHDPSAWPLRATSVRQPNRIHTEIGWEVYPEGLAECLRWVRGRYGPIPLYVTENGAAFYDPPFAIDGVVDDPLREHYLREHVAALGTALRDGVDVRGYFAWSLLDNVEWSQGRTRRFGLVHVNYADQTRTIKRSGHFYRALISRNGIAPPPPAALTAAARVTG
jgi:beta-glucosidase